MQRSIYFYWGMCYNYHAIYHKGGYRYETQLHIDIYYDTYYVRRAV